VAPAVVAETPLALEQKVRGITVGAMALMVVEMVAVEVVALERPGTVRTFTVEPVALVTAAGGSRSP